MSNLIVLGFDGKPTADEVLNKLRSMQKEYLIDLDESCVVERELNVRPISSKRSISRSLGRQAGSFLRRCGRPTLPQSACRDGGWRRATALWLAR